jgi:hypothetical protein
MSALTIAKEVGDGHAVQVLFDAAWKDHKAGGEGLTHAALMDYARLHLNMSGTFERYRLAQEEDAGNSAAARDLTVEFRPDRADPEWVAVAHWSAQRAYLRMRRTQPGSPTLGAGRARLLVAANRGEGRPAKHSPEVRWTVNIKDGRPVLPRVWRNPIHQPGRFGNYDPEGERLGVADHMQTLAWIQEARAELARPKPRLGECHALVEKALAIISVTGA